jgi:2'-5' RNA ligase
MRLFFAIKFPEKILKEIAQYQEKIQSDYWRLTPIDNLHLTLLFLGEVNDNALFNIKQIATQIQNQLKGKTIYLKLQRIEYGPNLLRPRLIWITGENNKELNLLNQLMRQNLKPFIEKEEHFDFTPHITIARFNTFIKPDKLPSLPQPDLFNNKIITIKSFYLMESKLSFQKGAQYFDLQEYCF